MTAIMEWESGTQDIMALEKAFPYLELPGEIRNEIYYLCVCRYPRKRTEAGKPFRKWNLGRSVRTLRPPPIAQVNSQIRSEVIRIFYEDNQFLIGCYPSLGASHIKDLLHKIKRIVLNPGIQFIRTLRFDLDDIGTIWGRKLALVIDFSHEPRTYCSWDKNTWKTCSGHGSVVACSTDGAWMARIGDDALDWGDIGAVENAIWEIVPDSYLAYRHWSDGSRSSRLGSVILCVFTLAQHCRNTKKFLLCLDPESQHQHD